MILGQRRDRLKRTRMTIGRREEMVLGSRASIHFLHIFIFHSSSFIPHLNTFRISNRLYVSQILPSFQHGQVCNFCYSSQYQSSKSCYLAMKWLVEEHGVDITALSSRGMGILGHVNSAKVDGFRELGAGHLACAKYARLKGAKQ